MSRFQALTVAEVRHETPDSVSIRFTVPESLKAQFAFKAGQYLTLRATIDGEDIRRSYSICAAEQDDELRVGIRKAPGGAFSTFANEHLKGGDTIEVAPPKGRFTPQIGGAFRHSLGIVAGSGITPVLSIARTLLGREPSARFTLVYGNRTSQSVMFAEEIEDMKNRYLGRFSVFHVLSREAPDVALLAGRITAAKIRALGDGAIQFAGVDEAFLCGPEELVAGAREALTELGVPSDCIRIERFTAAPPRKFFKQPEKAAEAGAVIARITATLDGKRHTFELRSSDESIIDAAARAGVDLPYSCKGGMCCTCRCKVESGRADMQQNYSLEPWEMKAGFILGCQARPTTPELALNFDQL